MSLEINGETLASLKPSKTLKYFKTDHPPEINSLDFSDSGEFCITGSNQDKQMHLYDCKTGTHKRKVPSLKYGCELVRFTHKSNNCIHTATEDSVVRYLSLHDTKYIRYFTGHEKSVIGLEMSPSDDNFLTASWDNTVQLWNLNQQHAIGKLKIPAPTLIAYDPTGMVFAVACRTTNSISMYDTRSPKAPFVTFQVECGSSVRWDKIEFSNNGKYILLVTDSFAHYVYDAFKGEPLQRLTGHSQLSDRQTGPPSSAAFSVDGNYVVGGSSNGNLTIWDIERCRYVENKPCGSLNGPHNAQLVLFNPKMFLMATADRELTFWLPSSD